MQRIILVGVLLLTAGCVTPPEGTATLRYMCSDGTAFFARYRPGAVVLDFGGGATKELVAPADATRGVYGAQGDAFRMSDYEATLALAGKPPVICRRGDVRDLAVIN